MNNNWEELKRLAEAVVNADDPCTAMDASIEFMQAIDPTNILELIRQRDELLSAAKLTKAWLDAEADHSLCPDFASRVGMCDAAENAINAAIANAEKQS